MTKWHKDPRRLWKLIEEYKNYHDYKGGDAEEVYKLRKGKHSPHLSKSSGRTDHRIPENLRYMVQTEPGKDADGKELVMEHALINLRDKAFQAVQEGVIPILNSFYNLNVDQIEQHGKDGPSSAIIKALSKFAGVFNRERFGKKDLRRKYTKEEDARDGFARDVSFNRDLGNWMYKAIVELLRLISQQMSETDIYDGEALVVPPDMNEGKVGDLVEAMIGELMIRYPHGRYEINYPYTHTHTHVFCKFIRCKVGYIVCSIDVFYVFSSLVRVSPRGMLSAIIVGWCRRLMISEMWSVCPLEGCYRPSL